MDPSEATDAVSECSSQSPSGRLQNRADHAPGSIHQIDVMVAEHPSKRRGSGRTIFTNIVQLGSLDPNAFSGR